MSVAMNLSGLISQIEGSPSLVRLREARARTAKSLTVGVPDPAKAAVVAVLASVGREDGPLLVIVPREDRAEALIEELSAWLGAAAPLVPFPERDPLPYERLAQTRSPCGSACWRPLDLLKGNAASSSPRRWRWRKGPSRRGSSPRPSAS